MKPLDIVKTPSGGIALITETNGGGEEATINYINKCNPNMERNAWWNKDELEVIDSLPRLLANATLHPFSSDKGDVDKFFSID